MSNFTSLPPIPADIASGTAPQLFGTLINWTLFGVLSVQTYVYYLNFPDDTIWNKLLVYGSYIIEVVQTAMTGADLYFWFATGFGDMNHLNNVNISPIDTPILCGLIAAIVQCFFAYRIYTLKPSYLWICILIVLTALMQTVAAMAVGWRAFVLQEYSKFHDHVEFPQAFDVWLIGDTVCDTLIAGTMLLLFHQSRKDGMRHGTQILGRLVRLVVETNTLTAGMALVSFVIYATLPGNSIFICTTLVMGKLYSNTLLVTFNNRIALRNMSGKTVYESGGSGRMPLRQAKESDAATFHVASSNFTSSFTVQSSQESYEIHKIHDKALDTIGSAV